MKKISRILSLILVFTFIAGTLPAGTFVFAAEEVPWDVSYGGNGRQMPFDPPNNYVSQQNPPDFTWSKMDGADSYDLIVASDPELTDIKYRKDGIKTNFYNFDTIFETGVHYYWAVRYNMGSTPSGWSTPRRFRIDPNAYEFPVPDIDTLLSRIPSTHPRILVTQDTLDEFRSYKDKYEGSKEVYDAIVKMARDYTEQNVIDAEPEYQTFDNFVEQSEFNQKLGAMANTLINKMLTCGFAYLLTEDKEIGDFAVRCLIALTEWDINGATSYENQDQVHRSIMYKGAIGYDWLYDLLTEEQKQQVLTMVRDRAKVMEYLLDSIEESPYDSHGWNAYAFIGIASLATYGELQEAEGWLRKAIPGYTCIMPPWSGQDGGWSQGTDYWQYSTGNTKEFMTIFALAGVINLFDKAFAHNEHLWTMYVYPAGSYGSFGDQANMTRSNDYNYTAISLTKQAYFTHNPVALWLYEQQNQVDTTDYHSYYARTVEDTMEPEAPYSYPLAHEFSDIGWVAMTDDLINPERIQLTFKSSPYGSFNHSHADQNSFIIQAFGEKLAVKSGYYDAYHSNHDSNFTRTTPAHNSVTVATSKGQMDDSMDAKGELTAFLTQQDFDLTSGDATQAYNGRLGKFERSIIYIRPDMFVVIDDLEAAPGLESSFEWWLNAEHAIKLYENENGAKITEGSAVLDAQVQYPEKVTSYYNDTFASSNMKEYPAEGRYAESNVQTRVWFETEKTDKTKMVVTLDVHRDDTEARYTDTEYYDDYMKMTFEDGTIILVNLGDNTNEVVTADGITFTGTAVAYNDDSIMLVLGTSLKVGDKEILNFEKTASVVLGENELGISTCEDNKICVNTNNEYVQGIEKITDYDGNEMGPAYGLTIENGKLETAAANTDTENEEETEDAEEEIVSEIVESDEYITISADADNYSLMLNGKLITSNEVSTTAKVTIDGTEQDVELTGYVRRDGTTAYSGKLTIPGAKYKTVEKSENLITNAAVVGNVLEINELTLSAQTADDLYISLETVPTTELKMTTNKDYDAVKDSLTIFKEAEDYTGTRAAGANLYTTRSFLSGGAGISKFDNLGTSMTYEIEVAEEGDYSFAVKYVAWLDGGAKRSFTIGDKAYSFSMEQTLDWGTVPENWYATVSDDTIHLTPGTYTITFGVLENSWNYDWFGFIKR